MVDIAGKLPTILCEINPASGTTVTHDLTYGYDMRSQLVDANITDFDDSNDWLAEYTYKKDGNIN